MKKITYQKFVEYYKKAGLSPTEKEFEDIERAQPLFEEAFSCSSHAMPDLLSSDEVKELVKILGKEFDYNTDFGMEVFKKIHEVLRMAFVKGYVQGRGIFE